MNQHCVAATTCRSLEVWAALYQLCRQPGRGPAGWPVWWALGSELESPAWGAASYEHTGTWPAPSASPCRRARLERLLWDICRRTATILLASVLNTNLTHQILNTYLYIYSWVTHVSYMRTSAGTAAMKPTSLLLVSTRTPQCHWASQLGGCKALNRKRMTLSAIWLYE